MKNYIVPSVNTATLVSELTSYVSGAGAWRLSKGLLAVDDTVLEAIPSLSTAFSELNLTVKEIGFDTVYNTTSFGFVAKQCGLVIPLTTPGISLCFYDIPEGTASIGKTLPDQLETYNSSDLIETEVLNFIMPIMINEGSCCTTLVDKYPCYTATLSFNEDVSDLFN